MSAGGRKPGAGGRAAVYVVLAAMAVAMMLPFYWLVRSSLADNRDVLRPIERLGDFVPTSVHPENYPAVFEAMPLWRYLLNTTIITGSVVVGSVISSSLCAYAFAFCRVRYGRWLFYGVLATMMLPGVVTMIPAFILFRELGWIDSFKPLILPACCGTPFAIFLFRQFFLSLPRELIEAARIDGATGLQIYRSIVLPLSRPVIVTVAIFAFMGSWNDFMGPLIYLNSQRNWTLQLGLSSFMGEIANQWNLLMAATVMVLLPVLVVFFILQRYFIRGIALTGLKG